MKFFGIKCFFFTLLFVAAAHGGIDGIRFDIERTPEGVPELHIHVPTLSGIRYQLRETADFGEWDNVGDSFLGNGTEKELVVATDKPAQFFEVVGTLQSSIVSTITGIEYPIHVITPEGYDSNANDYAVIYATDGQWITQGYAQAIRSKGKQLILVTIEQGPGDRRAIDYPMPGATNYYQFLITELLPAVESTYRIDPSKRSICGTSYGGLFAGYVLFMDDVATPYFKKILSFDGSFYYRSSYMNNLEQARYARSTQMNVTLFLTSATVSPNNHRVVEEFKDTLDARRYVGLRIYRDGFPVVHNDVAQPSFDRALDLLY